MAEFIIGNGVIRNTGKVYFYFYKSISIFNSVFDSRNSSELNQKSIDNIIETLLKTILTNFSYTNGMFGKIIKNMSNTIKTNLDGKISEVSIDTSNLATLDNQNNIETKIDNIKVETDNIVNIPRDVWEHMIEED